MHWEGKKSVQKKKAYPRLERSYKGAFPFMIGTTSFIYPEDYLPNVSKLAPYMDEIELLFFEGRNPASLPGTATIEKLKSLGVSANLTYNIHLPTDVDLGDTDEKKRCEAVDAVRQVMALTAPLCPTTHTLHLPWSPLCRSGNAQNERLGRFEKSLSALVRSDIAPQSISIETLNYPFERVAPLIDTFGFRVCLDLGHLLVHERDPAEYFDKYGDKTSIIHLHGVRDGRDHLSLDRLPPEAWSPIAAILKKFNGSVSLEVFSFEHLRASITFLEKAFGAKSPVFPPEASSTDHPI